jgi:hypothetical protein
MRRHWLARPHRANFARRVIADREYKIHSGSTGLREFTPTLAAQASRCQPRGFKLMNRDRIHAACGMTSRAKRVEIWFTPVVQKRFRQNRAHRIPCAQKQHIIWRLHPGASQLQQGRSTHPGRQSHFAATGFCPRMNALMNLSLICGPASSASKPAAARNSRASSTW